MALIILVFIATFFFMEFVAWFAHKYIMHGFLWYLHEDHHVKSRVSKYVEKNDAFFLIFATPSIISLIVGTIYGMPLALAFGFGIMAYGTCYFFVHDIFIHQRIKWFRNANHAYARAVRRAHKMHHKHLQKEDGECFGMLVFPIKYLRQELKKA